MRRQNVELVEVREAVDLQHERETDRVVVLAGRDPESPGLLGRAERVFGVHPTERSEPEIVDERLEELRRLALHARELGNVGRAGRADPVALPHSSFPDR